MRIVRPIPYRLDRFRNDPSSIRDAVWLIAGATVLSVVVGAVVIRVFDRTEYPTLGKALWFTLQTVTTVGYGDVTPKRTVGRAVASVVMITAIGFISVITAAITSTFVQAARRRPAGKMRVQGGEDDGGVAEALADIADRLGRIEARLDDLPGQRTGDDPGPRV